jgi:hypothetical protein
MAVGDDTIYVSVGTTVHMYSMPGYNHIGDFGKRGEGPGEFLSNWDNRGLFLDFQSKQLVACSIGKVAWFNGEGRLLRETRIASGRYRIPVNDHFVGWGFVTENGVGYQILNVYDPFLNLVRELRRQKHWRQPGQKIDPTRLKSPSFRIHDERIYAVDQTGNVDIFDKYGRRLFSTDLKYQPVKISEKQKQAYHDYFALHPAYKNLYAQYKRWLEFPEYFPPVKFYDVADERIYVLTYFEKEGKQEIFIFNSSGKFLKKIFLKIPPFLPHSLAHQRLTKIKHNCLYQLLENEDTDTWNLHITELK